MGIRIEGARILVAGGGSLVGSHLTAALLARGVGEIVVYDPIAFDAEDALGDLKSDARVHMVRGDLMKLHQIIEHMEGIDGAVNLAAYMTLGLSRTPIDAIDVNVRGHANFLEAARLRSVRKVVFASSNAVYGYGIGGGIEEDEPHHNAGIPAAAAAYGATKILGEQLCRIYKQKHGLDYIVLRFSTVYGENQHYRAANALYIIETWDRIRRGERPLLFGDGSESKDFVYAGDVARAICMGLESDATDVALNTSGGAGISTRDLVALVANIAGVEVEPDYIADDGRVRLPTGAGLHFVNRKAKEVLGWEPEMDLEEGIRRLVADHERRRNRG
ncbi:MAG TPA: NAD-dependent epimerase/dehydratase family protein [Paracoccaceae bacterium]|nr:NAD-dependent epimerase/dehydratase family protein [Paracoccaceae bacterium]